MKNRLLIFLGIFIFMIIPKNVFAESLVPGWATIDGTTFVANGEPLSTDKFYWIGDTGNHGTSGNLYVDITIDVMYENDEDVNNYPYVMLYVLSQTKDLSVRRNSSCTTTCFSDSIQKGIIGTSTYKNRTLYFYAFVLPIQKLYYDDGHAMYRVNDILRFSVPDNYYLTTWTNIWFTKDSSILNNAYTGEQIDKLTDRVNASISNNNSNTTLIINSITNAIGTTTSALDDIKNADLSSSDKQSPDTSDFNSYQSAENNLFGKMNNADIDDMQIAIDSNSSTWVWARITEWLSANSLLMSFLISMLSIGIIKMALGR